LLKKGPDLLRKASRLNEEGQRMVMFIFEIRNKALGFLFYFKKEKKDRN